MSATTTEILTGVLERAAAAHGVYETEQLGGRHHDEWPQWYAEHMARALAADGYRLVPGAASSTSRKLEVVVVPVSDVDRAKRFYQSLGWRLDADFVTGPDFRVVQLTPPDSECSIIFGAGVTTAAPGSMQGLQLTVVDIEAAHADLVGRGIDVDKVFHDEGGVFHHAGTTGRVDGPDPDRRDYGSFASFSDPDGNGWLLQEVTTRAPGR
ncbi:VOC family protein [Pseudonocardia lacus]|uniref:VOC family protein n=1 Tax=Pseudonocardia lacus TaxID=2835865 RepID=UPI0027E38B56|nr:VOC family protein [Pseudonocardia lacus]